MFQKRCELSSRTKSLQEGTGKAVTGEKLENFGSGHRLQKTPYEGYGPTYNLSTRLGKHASPSERN